MKKQTLSIISVIIFALLLTSTALAIGVSPTQTETQFEPAKTQELSLKIINIPQKEMKVLLHARGELSQYIKFKETIVDFSGNEEVKVITYTLSLPETMDKPGVHEAEIIATEYPSTLQESNPDSNKVRAVGAVVSKLQVRVPYPEKYLEGILQVYSANPDEDAVFTISLFNLGKEDISDIKAVIDIFGPKFEKITTLSTDQTPLAKSQSGKLVAKWTGTKNPGLYHAIVKVTYDNQEFTIEKQFDIGNLYVDVIGVNVANFRLGNVAKMDFFLQSRWNEEIKDLYGDITIRDKEKVYTLFKTPRMDISPLGNTTLIAYWDTSGVSVGTYTVDVLLSYAGRLTNRSFDINVNLDSIKPTSDISGEVIKGEAGTVTKSSLVVFLLALIIVINIGWFIYMKKFKNKSK